MRFGYDAGKKIYNARFKEEYIHIARRNRYKRYDKGIMKWINYLARSYKLDLVPVKKGDNFIDCGANIGELGMWSAQYGVKYHAFEPEEEEAFCCDLNNFAGKKHTHRKALWHEETELKFYSKPESADSSAIEINDYVDVKTIQATTIANFINTLEVPKIRLLKVEAEGAEPEVLQGAEGCFEQIDYVSVDCGNERGVEQLSTFVESDQILLDNGFEVIDSNLARPVFLYKRINLKD